MKATIKSIMNEYEDVIKMLLARRRAFMELYDKALFNEVDVDVFKTTLRNSISELNNLKDELYKLLAYIEKGIMFGQNIDVEE